MAQLTEKEREQELFNRVEKREALKTRYAIEMKLRKARKDERKKKKNILGTKVFNFNYRIFNGCGLNKK